METETGNVQENRYDAEGLRFELLENGRRTSFVYHNGELLQEEGREEQGTSYHLGAGMEAFRRGQELSYYHRDEQLSTVFVTDGQGEIRNSYQYDAFGIPLETTEQLNNRIRYTGQQYDELTEQYYLRARYYNPVAGRFMQEDVYQGDGLNLYAYCGNNPVVYDDPSGYASTSIGKACPPQGKISESVDESGSKTYKNSSDITKDIRQNKPLNSPAIDAWYGKNGTISIDENGVWTYHDWEGNSVSYPNGYPDFKSAGMVRQEVPIGPFVERNKDFAKAREMGYIKSADGTWHHHEDGVTLQEVETILHDRFRHRGGISNLKKK